MGIKYDFSGWATKNDIKCSDGRTIRKDAFKECDGQIVPLVWNHNHDEPFNVLGHALLENRDEGVYTYGFFNDTEQGANAKQLVHNGDITGLSIYANNLKQSAEKDVNHGVIREVSLVLASANPGAFIDTVLSHSEDSDEVESAIIYTGEDISLYHAEEAKETPAEDKEDKEEKKESSDEKEETVKDVVDSMTEKQKTVMYALIGEALSENKKEDEKDNEEGGSNTMKHNVFEQDNNTNEYLSHADVEKIFNDAKRCGSLREAFNNAVESGVLAHSIDTTGMDVAVGEQTYGFNDASMLFPDYKSLNNPPEWISRDMGWVQKVMSGVHHTPFSRIKSVYADITEDEARAKGYIKGKQKKNEVFTTLKRQTDPQTIYKLQKMDRDDILDITDFDVVAWLRAEMRVMLNEEIARSILIGDGRLSSSDDKISEDHIRPIASDVPLFNVKVPVSGNAKNIINGIIRSRKKYKGSGNPTFFTTEDTLTEMLLLEDGIGHKLYKTEAELATALRVKEIVTVEPMENQTISVDNKDLPLIGVIVNLNDYNVGADKGGEINLFEDFDIDYNQQKYLIETRISGALVKPFSALTVYLVEEEQEEQQQGSGS